MQADFGTYANVELLEMRIWCYC